MISRVTRRWLSGATLIHWVAACLAWQLLLFAPAPAQAAVSTCSATASGVTFPPYSAVDKAAVTVTASVTVTCSGTGNGNSVSVGLSNGSGGQCAGRLMQQGSSTLGYRIYRENSFLTDWCDAAGSMVANTFDFGLLGSQTKVYTLYGRIAADQTPGAVGSHSDSLVATVRSGNTSLATAAVPVSGSVPAACRIEASSLSFGPYASSSDRLTSSTISVTCSSTTAYSVRLGSGASFNGSTRRLAGPFQGFIPYQIFSDPAHTATWGDGGATGPAVAGHGSGFAQALPVYGRIPAGALVPAGIYTDVVTVSVDY